MWCVAALLGTGVAALALARRRVATRAGLCRFARRDDASPSPLRWPRCSRRRPSAAALTLPVGLPWLGAHFRLDALASFFLLVVNLGGAAASLFGLGYGRHEESPGRVLPFFPAFLAGMNLVVLAADAFTFLFAWEFMSLSSWALVMAHHRRPGNARGRATSTC